MNNPKNNLPDVSENTPSEKDQARRKKRTVARRNMNIGIGAVAVIVAGVIAATTFTNGIFPADADPEQQGKLNVVNSAQVTSSIPVGEDPKSLGQIDGKLYVGDRDQNAISVIDEATNKVIDTIPVPVSTLATDAQVKKIYAIDEAGNKVRVVDAVTRSVVATIPVGNIPTAVATSPATGKIYVSNTLDQSVSVIDAQTNAVVKTLQFEGSTGRIMVDQGTNKVYIAANNNLVVWDATTETSVTLKLSAEVISLNYLDSANGGIHLIFAGLSSGNVQIIEPNGHLGGVLNTGDLPTGIASYANTEQATLFVTNNKSNTVGVFDLLTNQRVGNIEVGPNPFAIKRHDTTLYVTNIGNSTVSVLAIKP